VKHISKCTGCTLYSTVTQCCVLCGRLDVISICTAEGVPIFPREEVVAKTLIFFKDLCEAYFMWRVLNCTSIFSSRPRIGTTATFVFALAGLTVALLEASFRKSSSCRVKCYWRWSRMYNIFHPRGPSPLFRALSFPYGVSRSQSDTPHSVRLLRTSDQLDVQTFTWQHKTLTWPLRNSNPQSQQASGRRLTP
jgi:hypothetical protein